MDFRLQKRGKGERAEFWFFLVVAAFNLILFIASYLRPIFVGARRQSRSFGGGGRVSMKQNKQVIANEHQIHQNLFHCQSDHENGSWSIPVSMGG
jgi:hypothetical protein